ncbi:MAG: PAS domain S-box protein [Bacteroidetes bacterium]|nr:PAS domain S-box protein [Bacteroidota bacterium]
MPITNPNKPEYLKCAAALLLALAILFIDFQLPLGIAIGMFYALPLLATLWIRHRPCPLVFSILFTLFILIGFIKPLAENVNWNVAIVNRAFSVLIVWLCLFFISKTKEHTAQLKKSSKEATDYKFSLDETAIVAITDVKGIIQQVNDNFCKISKYTREELIGQDHRIINSGHHPKEFFKELYATIANGKIWRGDVKNKAKDGSYYWIDTSIVPFLSEQGKPYQYVVIRTDITDRKNAEEQIKKMNAELEQKVIERTEKLTQSEKQIRNFAAHLNKVLEDERAHIAREMHDDIGQQLTGIKMGISSFKKLSNADNGIEAKINGMMKDADNTIQSLRKIATQLRPGILDTLGLIPSIEWLAGEFEKKTGIKCKVTSSSDIGSSLTAIVPATATATAFFRICQESLNNISKHAKASEVVINVNHDKDSLMLKVSDNGKGISSEKLENPFSMGLLGMRERANIIDADFEIMSKKDFGTTVQLKTKLK